MQTFADVYRFRHVLYALTAKELKAQYRNMSLGFVWALLNPLVMVTVLSVAFITFFDQGREHPSRVVVALIPYNFVVYCLSGCSVSIVANSSLVRKVRFPRQILPMAVILTHLVHFAVQALLIVAVLLLFPTAGPVLTPNLLWLLPILVVHVSFCIGGGMLAAALNVVFRDTRYIVDSLLTVLFWISPVVYDARAAFEASGGRWTAWERAYFLNPVAGILDSYRAVLFHGTAPDAFVFGVTTALVLVLGIVGLRVFWVYERDFAELIR